MVWAFIVATSPLNMNSLSLLTAHCSFCHPGGAKIMKKNIVFTLIAFLLGTAFVACGGEKSTSAPDSTESSESRLYLSSSVVKTYLSSSSKKAITPADVTHGSFVDERDGQSYKTVAIGEQVWMAENLNYASESSFCYYGLDEACKNAGRLYTYEAAEKVCPKGYRLPTREDFAIMLRPLSERIQEASLDWSYYMAPFGIMSKEGWNECTQSFVGGVTYPTPTNSTGFSAVGAGYRSSHGSFMDLGERAVFWCSTDGPEENTKNALELDYCSFFAQFYWWSKKAAFSVRCIKE